MEPSSDLRPRFGAALFLFAFSIAGWGAIFIGADLAGASDCGAFPGAFLSGACDRFGAPLVAAPLILVGVTLLVSIVLIVPRLKPPPARERTAQRRSGWITKLGFLLTGLGMIVYGVLLATRVEPCSSLKSTHLSYRVAADGLANLCAMFGPGIPAALFIGVGGLFLFGLYKGAFDIR